MSDNPATHVTWAVSDRLVPRIFVRPVQRFMQIEASSGIVMLLAAVIAVAWANSSAAGSYFRLLDLPVVVEIGPLHLEETLLLMINDGLMALFFFVVALEIKREIVEGELHDVRAAALPVLAALGGMLVPALIYTAIAAPLGPEALRGWGVPMATDIAFSAGVLSLLGRRVPASAKIFLLTLAVADDLGWIIVIAVAYTTSLAAGWLGAAVAGLLVIALANRSGVRSMAFYVPAGVAVWYFVLESGIHATLAGVALAFLTPSTPMYTPEELDSRARDLLEPLSSDGSVGREIADYNALLVSTIARESVDPLTRLEQRLQTFASFVVVPLFALANAGVRFEGGVVGALTTRVALAVAVALVVGKTVGITLFSWVAVRTGAGRLPSGATWRHMVGVAATAGIGFTVALFITALAYRDPALTADAKVGIFAGSIAAGILGSLILGTAPPAPADAPELAAVEAR